MLCGIPGPRAPTRVYKHPEMDAPAQRYRGSPGAHGAAELHGQTPLRGRWGCCGARTTCCVWGPDVRRRPGSHVNAPGARGLPGATESRCRIRHRPEATRTAPGSAEGRERCEGQDGRLRFTGAPGRDDRLRSANAPAGARRPVQPTAEPRPASAPGSLREPVKCAARTGGSYRDGQPGFVSQCAHPVRIATVGPGARRSIQGVVESANARSRDSRCAPSPHLRRPSPAPRRTRRPRRTLRSVSGPDPPDDDVSRHPEPSPRLSRPQLTRQLDGVAGRQPAGEPPAHIGGGLSLDQRPALE
jgi:hypothetical protein